MLFSIVLILLHSYTLNLADFRNKVFIKGYGIVILIFTIIYMGFRPNHEIFADMRGYGYNFQRYQEGDLMRLEKGSDYLFELYTYLCGKVMGLRGYYVTCAIIYVLPLYSVSKKWFKEYWFYSFFMFIVSFSFWSYGTNGIRNGLASSIFIYALSKEKLKNQILFFVIAVGFHKSMLLPLFGFIISKLNISHKKILVFWLLTIPFSLVFGTYFEIFFANLGFDDRLSYLTDSRYDDLFSSSGFRWDFLLYSAVPVYIGWYFLTKHKIKDDLYNVLYITYVISNAFWILIIQASFSNRFAYLSWFMMAVIIIYPFILLPLNATKNNKNIAIAITLYFIFTYTLNVIL